MHFIVRDKTASITAVTLLTAVIITIVYGQYIEGEHLRRWSIENLLWIAPVFPLLFLQQQAGLPSLNKVLQPNVWILTTGTGLLFGLLDVIIFKTILHPQPYNSLPPFLQPFPYSLALYFSGAAEVELYYRMLPLTLILLLCRSGSMEQYRQSVIVGLGIITSLIEPLQQLPDGAPWLIAYAFVSGVAMNAWQFICYLRYGWIASLLVRLGHYLLWHILLGLYVELFEIAAK